KQSLIRALPGYGPVQLAVVGALTDDAPQGVFSRAAVWAAIALVASLVVFWLRIRPARQNRSEHARLVWHYAKVLVVAYAIWLGLFELVGRYAATLHPRDLSSAWDHATPL